MRRSSICSHSAFHARRNAGRDVTDSEAWTHSMSSDRGSRTSVSALSMWFCALAAVSSVQFRRSQA